MQILSFGQQRIRQSGASMHFFFIFIFTFGFVQSVGSHIFYSDCKSDWERKPATCVLRAALVVVSKSSKWAGRPCLFGGGVVAPRKSARRDPSRERWYGQARATMLLGSGNIQGLRLTYNSMS